ANTYGGGVHELFSGPLTLRSSILAGNTASGNNPDLSPGPGLLTMTNSLLGDNTGTTLASTGPMNPDADGNLIGSASSPIDPQTIFAPLAYNGGLTPTHALVLGSPAIDLGSNPLNLVADQRGFSRVIGAKADMGAYELQHLSMIV